MSAPLLTIGIPTFNRLGLLRRAVKSALDQDCGDLEILIADNASPDGTEEYCRELAAREPAVRYIRHSVPLHTVAWFVVAVPLLMTLGVVAAGLGTLAASIVEGIVLGRAVRERTGARLLGALVIPLLAATAAAAGAAAIAATSLGDALQATLAAVIAATTYALILLALQQRDLMSLARLVRGAVRPATV